MMQRAVLDSRRSALPLGPLSWVPARYSYYYYYYYYTLPISPCPGLKYQLIVSEY